MPTIVDADPSVAVVVPAMVMAVVTVMAVMAVMALMPISMPSMVKAPVPIAGLVMMAMVGGGNDDFGAGDGRPVSEEQAAAEGQKQ